MNDPEPLEFERIADSCVYETRVGGSVGWSGYLMPASGTLPDEIPVASSLDGFPGHYLFSARRPALLDTDPAGFAAAALEYITSSTSNRVALWLSAQNPLDFGTFEERAFAFGPSGTGGYELRSNMGAPIDSEVSFNVLEQCALRIDPDVPGLRISANDTPATPFIGFDRNGNDAGIAVTGSGGFIRARVPVSGTNTGCFVFTATMIPGVTFEDRALGPSFRYVVNDRTRGEVTIDDRAYPVGAMPSPLALVGTVDPSDPVNTAIATADLQSGHLRSGFTIPGSPALTSHSFTPQGNTVVLTPLGTGLDDVVPPLMAGGFSWASPSPATGTPGRGRAYLAPTGSHGVGVQGMSAGQKAELLCGLFGSERLTFRTYDPGLPPASNDLLFFLASQPGYAPAFPFDVATLDDPDSGRVRERLTPERLVPWAAFLCGASAVEYSAEPEGSPLYGDCKGGARASGGDVPVLLSAPPRMKIGCGTKNPFPLVPYGDAANAGVDGDTLTQFESQILAPTRKQRISAAASGAWEARRRARLRAVQGDAPSRTTPQGFVVQVDPSTSAYLGVRMAQSLNRRAAPLRCGAGVPDYLPFAFEKPTRAVEDALQTNQLFLVAVDEGPFDDPAQGACFESTVNLADWTMTARVGKDATATSYRNVVIFKYCSGALVDRITNPNRWTAPDPFSLLAGTPPELAALTYTGLSQWLQDYVATGIARANGPSAAFYRNFERIVTDPEWNGVIVLAADLGAADLPPSLAALAAGIDLAQFAAHHFGFTASRVEVDPITCAITMSPGDSSLFGLVDYQDPRFALNLATGVNPDTPIVVRTEDDLDFTVLQLQSLFENAKLTDFQSRIQLTVNRLLGAEVTKLFAGGAPQPSNGVVLSGSYVDQGGEPSYVFQQARTNVLAADSNVLPAVAWTRVQFNTLGTVEENGTTTVASRFVVWGAFDFAELSDTGGQLLDVTSFGSPKGTSPDKLGAGLAFSNLVVGMTFPETTPTSKTFAVDSANMAWDQQASTAREQSLFRGFGLSLKSFVSASAGQTAADLGFLPVSSGLDLTEIEAPWFGVVYEITLGGPGALASAMGFTSTLLVAWSPSTGAGDSARALFLGMSLPGAAPGAKLFSLQGVFKVAVGAIALLRQLVPKAPGRTGPDEFFYCLRIDDIGLKIFGIVKLPPSANIQFFLFGDPANTGSLGWYAAYVADDNPGCNQQLAFAQVGGEPPPPRAPTAGKRSLGPAEETAP